MSARHAVTCIQLIIVPKGGRARSHTSETHSTRSVRAHPLRDRTARAKNSRNPFLYENIPDVAPTSTTTSHPWRTHLGDRTRPLNQHSRSTSASPSLDLRLPQVNYRKSGQSRPPLSASSGHARSASSRFRAPSEDPTHHAPANRRPLDNIETITAGMAGADISLVTPSSLDMISAGPETIVMERNSLREEVYELRISLGSQEMHLRQLQEQVLYQENTHMQEMERLEANHTQEIERMEANHKQEIETMDAYYTQKIEIMDRNFKALQREYQFTSNKRLEERRKRTKLQRLLELERRRIVAAGRALRWYRYEEWQRRAQQEQ